MRIDIEGVVVTKGVGNVLTKIGEGEVETVRKDELGGVRKRELVERATGAYSEPYAPLPA